MNNRMHWFGTLTALAVLAGCQHYPMDNTWVDYDVVGDYGVEFSGFDAYPNQQVEIQCWVPGWDWWTIGEASTQSSPFITDGDNLSWYKYDAGELEIPSWCLTCPAGTTAMATMRAKSDRYVFEVYDSWGLECAEDVFASTLSGQQVVAQCRRPLKQPMMPGDPGRWLVYMWMNSPACQ